MKRTNLIHREVDKLLEESSVLRAPVPVEKIATEQKVTIRYEPFPDDNLSGMVMVNSSGQSIIGVNSNHSETRKRFSVAHELGHFILHHKEEFHIDDKPQSMVLFRDDHSSTGVDPKEVEANYFAACLLMPEKLVRDYIVNNPLQGDAENFIKKIAKEFEVSIQAMTLRLAKLGYLSI